MQVISWRTGTLAVVMFVAGVALGNLDGVLYHWANDGCAPGWLLAKPLRYHAQPESWEVVD